MFNKLFVWFVYVFTVFACLSYLRAGERMPESRIPVNQNIEPELIDTGTRIHTSYQKVPRWGRVSANGLLIADGGRSIPSLKRSIMVLSDVAQ